MNDSSVEPQISMLTPASTARSAAFAGTAGAGGFEGSWPGGFNGWFDMDS
jgi:hypothetical protein